MSSNMAPKKQKRVLAHIEEDDAGRTVTTPVVTKPRTASECRNTLKALKTVSDTVKEQLKVENAKASSDLVRFKVKNTDTEGTVKLVNSMNDEHMDFPCSKFTPFRDIVNASMKEWNLVEGSFCIHRYEPMESLADRVGDYNPWRTTYVIYQAKEEDVVVEDSGDIDGESDSSSAD